jgi:sulfopyruvate decarboxylase alpha subunit
MDDVVVRNEARAGQDWPLQIYQTLKAHGVSQISYVPDAGHSRLIELSHGDAAIQTTVLTTEEEGVALSAGAWLGGDRSVLLMQSSGVGNCVNMLSLTQVLRFPFLTLVTMRGEWGEFNPWQVPMGSSTAAVFELSGVRVLRASRAEEVREVVEAAAGQAYNACTPTAVLLSQRLIGAKVFTK